MKTKRERFETIAAGRVQKTLISLDSLGRCSNPKNYEYSENDIKKMEKVIKEKLSETLALFYSGIKKEDNLRFKF